MKLLNKIITIIILLALNVSLYCQVFNDTAYQKIYGESSIKTEIKHRFLASIFKHGKTENFKQTYGTIPYMYDYPIIVEKTADSVELWNFYKFKIFLMFSKIQVLGQCSINSGVDNCRCEILETHKLVNDTLFESETNLNKFQILNGFIAINRRNNKSFIINSFIGKDSPFEAYNHIINSTNNDDIKRFISMYYYDYDPAQIEIEIKGETIYSTFYSGIYKKKYKVAINKKKKQIKIK